MEKLPKRRGLSLSLSQQGREQSRKKRNCTTTRSFDASSLDIKQPDVKEPRNTRNSESHNASILPKNVQMPSSQPPPKSEIVFESFKDSKCVERNQTTSVTGTANKQVDSLKHSGFAAFPTVHCEKLSDSLKPCAEKTHTSNCDDGRSTKNPSPKLRMNTTPEASEAKTSCENGIVNSPISMIVKDSEQKMPCIMEPNEENCDDNSKSLSSGKSVIVGENSAMSSNVPHSLLGFVEDQEVPQCPLCFKNFDKKYAKSAHLKACAMKHGMTTQQLLDALELQKRQVAERRALGLPISVSGLKPKKSSSSRKEKVPKMDNGLQLALALSLSLQDQGLAASHRETMEGSSTCLENYGFVSKPVLESGQSHQISSSSKSKGKSRVKKFLPLLTRTSEERQQITTEKVAMILMEDIDLTEEDNASPIKLVSELLQDYHKEEKPLWGKSQLSPAKANRASYYVKELGDFISPSIVETGSKVKHLSQIAGRIRTPEKEKKHSDNTSEKDNRSVQSITLSDEDVSSESCSRSSKISVPLSVPKIEVELRAKLFNDWAGMVNSSSMSDLIIYPQEGREIHAHKLVLFVRCCEMYHDIVKQRNPLTGNDVEVILWSKIPHAAGLAFLEYVYCGSVKSIPALCDDRSSIKWLASRYKVADLLRYLKAISSTRLPSSQAAVNAVHDLEDSEPFIPSVQDTGIALSPHPPEEVQECASLSPKESDVKVKSKISEDVFQSPSASEVDSIYSYQTLSRAGSRSRSISPDIFQDEPLIVDSPVGRKTALEDENAISNNSLSEHNIQDNKPPSRPASCQLSTCSDSTVLLRAESPIFSSAFLKNLSPKEPNPALNGSFDAALEAKRKLSNSSDDEEENVFKRLCSQNIMETTLREKDLEAELSANVELLDLTLDSNSGCSSLSKSRRSSKGSCDSVIISSDNELPALNVRSEERNVTSADSDRDENLEAAGTSNQDSSSLQKTPKRMSMRNSESPISDSEYLQSTPVKVDRNAEDFRNIDDFQKYNKSLDRSKQPYISPLWDGFEDLNFVEPCSVILAKDSQEISKGRENISLNPSPTCLSSISPSREKQTTFKKSVTTDCTEKEKEKVHFSLMVLSDSDTNDDVLENVGNAKASSSLEMLLDDSFDNVFSDSILQKAEKQSDGVPKLASNSVAGTPVRSGCVVAEAITPMANYDSMRTPDLKKEMKKFGLKPTLGKRKGKIMLQHIYNELHPWVPDSTKKSNLRKISLSQPQGHKSSEPLSSSQPSTSEEKVSSSNLISEFGDKAVVPTPTSDSECESDSSSCPDEHEGSFLEDCENEFEPASQVVSQCARVNLWNNIKNIIKSDPELHQKIVEYEPIWIENFHNDIRRRGVKIKMADLMAILDEKCITFRSVQGGPRIKKKKSNKNPSKNRTDTDEEAELSV